MRRPLIALSILLGLAGCEDSARPLAPVPELSVEAAELPLVPRVVAPAATDPAITYVPPTNPARNHHFVWLDPSQHTNPRLFVMLPGTGGRPFGNQFVQQEAARLGYHVIGLMYESDVAGGAVHTACLGSADTKCSENVRLEMLDGSDRSPFVNVAAAGSIANRLSKLLAHLDAVYPGEGWSGFLEDGAPRWSRIAVGGHSDGAGQAALIAMQHHVFRVVMLSGPSETRVAGRTDDWLAIGETPAVKHFALVHAREPRALPILDNLGALGLARFGAPVTPELTASPFDRAHILLTDLEPPVGPTGANPHNSTAIDAFTPRGPDGTPLLREAWRYLLIGR